MTAQLGGEAEASAAAARVERQDRRGWAVMGALMLGYIGVYLCRKNFSVAVPLLTTAFGATRAEVGWVASIGTLTYAVGKVVNGPIVDRIGGRRGFLIALTGVALFGAAGAFAPGLGVLAMVYGGNRFAGAAGWGAMLKLVPSWFGPARTGTAVGVLSLSYVGGGILATLLAREIVRMGGGWQAVMGVPSLILGTILLVCFFLVHEGPRQGRGKHASVTAGQPRTPALARRAAIVALISRPQFLITCALSFTVTLMREAFNTWSVDFLLSIQKGGSSLSLAALQSIGFDMAGMASILIAGIAYDRTPPEQRRWLMSGSLGLLAVVMALLCRVSALHPAFGMLMVGAAGFLVYGPYSLLAGTLAVENGGVTLAATAAGIIDGTGYVAGALSGVTLGRLLDIGGYALGFNVLAGVTAAAALIALALRPAVPAA